MNMLWYLWRLETKLQAPPPALRRSVGPGRADQELILWKSAAPPRTAHGWQWDAYWAPAARTPVGPALTWPGATLPCSWNIVIARRRRPGSSSREI